MDSLENCEICIYPLGIEGTKSIPFPLYSAQRQKGVGTNKCLRIQAQKQTKNRILFWI
jgi:hypothetical protein